MKQAAHILMSRAVDYAGLFPPAGLSMDEAVRNYADYARTEHAWMLGRFIVPAARLQEFAKSLEANCCAERDLPWMLSLLASKDAEADIAAMEQFVSGAAFVDALELRAESAVEAERLLAAYPRGISRFVECPPAALPQILPVLLRYGANAKIRTGGVTPEAIPGVETVADFLLVCHAAGVACKATAGLHHAMRGEYPLTYETGAVRATMHGFLNLLAAMLLVNTGAPKDAVVSALESIDPRDFRFTRVTFRWREYQFSRPQIEAARQQGLVSFGSCSFLEPVQTLADAMKEKV